MTEIDQLKQRVAELEAQLKSALGRIAELESTVGEIEECMPPTEADQFYGRTWREGRDGE